MNVTTSVLLLFSFIQFGWAFGTIDVTIPISIQITPLLQVTIYEWQVLGQHAEHEHITRAALACQAGSFLGACFEPLSLDQLAGKHNSFGAVGDPDRPRKPSNIFSIDDYVEGKYAHCDDADFLATDDYPRKRNDSTAELQGCISHLRDRVIQGVSAGVSMLTDQDLIKAAEVRIDDCEFLDSGDDNAKCRALQGFGRALHGVQDFYSHSNWADRAGAGAINILNPPGLHRSVYAPFLDLRTNSRLVIEKSSDLYDVSTGCYAGIGHDKPDDKSGVCGHRIIHKTLNKDEGIIEIASGDTSDPGTERGKIPTNFDDAVQAAIRDTRRQWRHFGWELTEMWGALRANRIACAMTRDNPARDCQGRKIAIVVDSSSSNLDTDPKNLRVAAASAFNSKLTTKDKAGVDGVSDLVTVIDFDSSARVIYPLGDPAGAATTFSKIDSSGGTYIAGGVKAAIDEIEKEKGVPTKDKSGIIVLTDGQDSSTTALKTQVDRAKEFGIRVWFGFLESPTTSKKLTRRQSTGVSADLLKAIVETGGAYSTITSAEAQQAFIDLVIGRGATAVENSIGLSVLKPGLSTVGSISSTEGSKFFALKAAAGQNLNITLSLVQPSAGITLSAILHDIKRNQDLSTIITNQAGKAVITLATGCDRDLELVVTPTSTSTGSDLFSIEVQSTSTNSIDPNAASCALDLAPPTPENPLRLVTVSNGTNTTSTFSATTTGLYLNVSSTTSTSLTTSSFFNTTVATSLASNTTSRFYPDSTTKSQSPYDFHLNETSSKNGSPKTITYTTECPITFTKTIGSTTTCITTNTISTVTEILADHSSWSPWSTTRQQDPTSGWMSWTPSTSVSFEPVKTVQSSSDGQIAPSPAQDYHANANPTSPSTQIITSIQTPSSMAYPTAANTEANWISVPAPSISIDNISKPPVFSTNTPTGPSTTYNTSTGDSKVELATYTGESKSHFKLCLVITVGVVLVQVALIFG